MTVAQDRILIVDDEPVVLDFLSDVLSNEGFSVSCASEASQALDILAKEPHDLVLSDIRMPGFGGFELLKSVRRRSPGTDVILMTGYASVDGAIDAMTLGAVDYLIKPLKPKEIVARIRACIERRHLESQIHSLRSELRSRYDRHNIVAESPRMRAVVSALNRVAPLDEPILLMGEPGSGRHFIARAIHHASARREERMAEFECDRTPPNRAAEMLFGHARPDVRRRPGQFERLRNGTLHLAEFSQLHPEVQRSIARCLRERVWRTEGEDSDRPLETRLVFSSSTPLEDLLDQGVLVPELAFVTEMVTLHIPALRDRSEDIPGLVEAYVQEHAVENGRLLEIPGESVHVLRELGLPGNVRTLHLILGHAATLSPDGLITPELVKRSLEHSRSGKSRVGKIADHLDQREYQLVLQAVQRYPRRLDDAARELGVSRTTLWRRMRKYDIRVGAGQGVEKKGL